MHVGEKIAAWRNGLDLKQKDVAKRAGVSQALWSKLEDGRMKRVGLEVARRIVEVTSGAISLDDFSRPRGRKVRPVPPPDSTTNLVDGEALGKAG